MKTFWNRTRHVVVAWSIWTCLFLTGCQTEPPRFDEAAVNFDRIDHSEPFKVGDTITIVSPDPSVPPYQETIKPDGMIRLPVVGDVKAAGLTSAQFQDQINELLHRQSDRF